MAIVTKLSLRIYGGAQSTGFDKQPLVAVGNAPDGLVPMPPTIVDEQQSWMITHAQSYTMYALYTKRYLTSLQLPGQLLFCIFMPVQQRLGEGKSPLNLLDSLMDQFAIQGLVNDCLPSAPIDSSPFKLLLDRYRMEPRPLLLPIMQGHEAAAFCCENRAQLDALMRHSRYNVLGGVGRLEVGFHCKSTIVLSTTGAGSKSAAGAKSTPEPSIAPQPTSTESPKPVTPPVPPTKPAPAPTPTTPVSNIPKPTPTPATPKTPDPTPAPAPFIPKTPEPAPIPQPSTPKTPDPTPAPTPTPAAPKTPIPPAAPQKPAVAPMPIPPTAPIPPKAGPVKPTISSPRPSGPARPTINPTPATDTLFNADKHSPKKPEKEKKSNTPLIIMGILAGAAAIALIVFLVFGDGFGSSKPEATDAEDWYAAAVDTIPLAEDDDYNEYAQEDVAAEEDAAAQKAAEEAAKKKAEEDAAAEAARKKAEEDARKAADEAAKKKAEEDARKKAEEERKKREAANWKSQMQSLSVSCPITLRSGVRITSITTSDNSVTFTLTYDLAKFDIDETHWRQFKTDQNDVKRRYASNLPAGVNAYVLLRDCKNRPFD